MPSVAMRLGQAGINGGLSVTSGGYSGAAGDRTCILSREKRVHLLQRLMTSARVAGGNESLGKTGLIFDFLSIHTPGKNHITC